MNCFVAWGVGGLTAWDIERNRGCSPFSNSRARTSARKLETLEKSIPLDCNLQGKLRPFGSTFQAGGTGRKKHASLPQPIVPLSVFKLEKFANSKPLRSSELLVWLLMANLLRGDEPPAPTGRMVRVSNFSPGLGVKRRGFRC